MGLANREASIGGSISIFSAVRVCLNSPGLPWSILNAYFSPWTSRKSDENDSQGTSWSSVFRLSHALPLQKQKSIGINEVKPHVSVFVREFKPIDGLVVQFLFAGQLDLCALGLVANHRPVEIVLIGNVPEVFRERRLGLLIL